MTPATVTIEVKLQQIMAGSNPENGFTMSGAGELSNGITSGNMSRRASDFWDDDED